MQDKLSKRTLMKPHSLLLFEKFLSKKNAIILNVIKGIKQIEYLNKFVQVIDLSSVHAAFIMSDNRFCLFSNMNDKHPTIIIGIHMIKLGKLINPAKRIIISNVCLNNILHCIIEK